MESDFLKARKEGIHIEEPQLQSLKGGLIHDVAREIADPTEVKNESVDSSTEERDISDMAVGSDSDGGEWEMPLFVQVKEEPNSDYDGDSQEGNFQTTDTPEKSFEGRSGHSVSKLAEGRKSGKRVLKEGFFGDSSGVTAKCQEPGAKRRYASSSDVVGDGVANEHRSNKLATEIKETCSAEGSHRSESDKALSPDRNSTALVQIQPGEKPYKCSQCDKSYAHSSNLSAHMRIHTGKKPYLCSQCGKAFSYFGNLTDHMRIHTGERPYKCSQCDKAFSHGSSLTAHLRIHTEEKPYQCSECNKAFSRRYHLTTHMRVHTGEKPYKCSQCEKAFSQSYALTVHMRIHTGEKPFKCCQCEKMFCQSNALNVHMLTHSGEKT